MDFKNDFKPGDFKNFEFCFEYDAALWISTVRHSMVIYGGKQVYFINIKLPNDGFFYTDAYSDDGDESNFIVKQETIDFIYSICDKISGNTGINIESNMININNEVYLQRFSMYIWISDNQCITVKFEYGSHCGIDYRKNTPDRFARHIKVQWNCINYGVIALSSIFNKNYDFEKFTKLFSTPNVELLKS